MYAAHFVLVSNRNLNCVYFENHAKVWCTCVHREQKMLAGNVHYLYDFDHIHVNEADVANVVLMMVKVSTKSKIKMHVHLRDDLFNITWTVRWMWLKGI